MIPIDMKREGSGTANKKQYYIDRCIKYHGIIRYANINARRRKITKNQRPNSNPTPNTKAKILDAHGKS